MARQQQDIVGDAVRDFAKGMSDPYKEQREKAWGAIRDIYGKAKKYASGTTAQAAEAPKKVAAASPKSAPKLAAKKKGTRKRVATKR